MTREGVRQKIGFGTLLFATLLVVVPVVYTFFDDLGTWVKLRLTRSERAARAAEASHRGTGKVPGTAPAGAPASPEVAS